jgi:GDP-L-fucose synthase
MGENDANSLDWGHLRVVLTGGAGFLGKHVEAELRRVGAEDITIPRSKDYDLRLQTDVSRLYADANPDVVIHLAAVVGGIGANQLHPGSFFYDNLSMGIHLIEEARRVGVAKFVAIGTICAYPKHTPVPFKEADLWDGYPEETNAPYGLAKKMLLVQLQAYREEYGFKGVYLLPVNLYGPGDNFDLETSHVIPAMIRKFLAAKERGDREVSLWGDGSPTREFLYAADAAAGIVLAAEKYVDSEPVNLGSGVEISIGDLAEWVSEATGYSGKIAWDTTRPNGQPRRCLDTSLAKRAFGFEARMDLKEGIRQTVEWYLEQGNE